MKLPGTKLALALVLAATLSAPAHAQTKNIDQLNAGTTPSATDVVPAVQGVDPAVKLQLGQILSALIGNYVAISAGCGNSTGAGAVQVGTINSQLVPVIVTAANAPIITSYCGELIQLNNGSAQTPTIAQAGSAGFAKGWFTTLCNIGAGAQTLTPAAGTIAGASSFVIGSGTATAPTCIGIASDGTSDYKVVAGNGVALSGTNSWTGPQTFSEVIGTETTQSGTTYTFANTDCGTDVRFTSNSAVTATIPTTLTVGCHINVIQRGTAKVSVNGTAVSACTLTSGHSYTGTSGTAGSVVGIIMDAANTCILTGDGS